MHFSWSSYAHKSVRGDEQVSIGAVGAQPQFVPRGQHVHARARHYLTVEHRPAGRSLSGRHTDRRVVAHRSVHLRQQAQQASERRRGGLLDPEQDHHRVADGLVGRQLGSAQQVSLSERTTTASRSAQQQSRQESNSYDDGPQDKLVSGRQLTAELRHQEQLKSDLSDGQVAEFGQCGKHGRKRKRLQRKSKSE